MTTALVTGLCPRCGGRGGSEGKACSRCRGTGAVTILKSEMLARHPLPWAVANTLIWDGNGRLIDIGRREVRELLVELVNGLAPKEEAHGEDNGTQDARHD